LSQFSDDEVEIVYLPLKEFGAAYFEDNPDIFRTELKDNKHDQFETFADLNRSGHQSASLSIPANGRYLNEPSKGSIRRKISLTSIANMWSK